MSEHEVYTTFDETPVDEPAPETPEAPAAPREKRKYTRRDKK